MMMMTMMIIMIKMGRMPVRLHSLYLFSQHHAKLKSVMLKQKDEQTKNNMHILYTDT